MIVFREFCVPFVKLKFVPSLFISKAIMNSRNRVEFESKAFGSNLFINLNMSRYFQEYLSNMLKALLLDNRVSIELRGKEQVRSGKRNICRAESHCGRCFPEKSLVK